MTRPRRLWFHDLKLLRRRLAGFNQQGKRYRHPPVSWDEFILGLRQARPQLLENCTYCNRRLTCKGPSCVSFDHTVPLWKGGLHSLVNISFSCKVCNAMKGAWDADFYRALLSFLDQWGMRSKYFQQVRHKY